MSRPIFSSQVAAFRLARQHLNGKGRANVVTLCRDVGGVQAQVSSAAELQLWARNHALTGAGIQAALWNQRTLVKTSLMRQTLHWIPASEFSLYIAALQRSRLAFLRRIMWKYASVAPRQIDTLTAAIVEALADGPLTRRELAERITPRVSKQVRKWMKIAWGIMTVRPALVEGLICYGPDRGPEPTFVLADRWLPGQKEVDEAEAQRFLLRRYLSSFGPAALRDFCKWAGLPVRETASVWEDLRPELIEISVEGRESWLLRRDQAALENSRGDEPQLRLLPSFDPFLLGHAAKDHIVEARHYKRIFRAGARVSPAVLLGGRAIGIWSHTRGAKSLLVEVRPFAALSKPVRARIEEEATSLARFLGAPLQLSIAR